MPQVRAHWLQPSSTRTMPWLGPRACTAPGNGLAKTGPATTGIEFRGAKQGLVTTDTVVDTVAGNGVFAGEGALGGSVAFTAKLRVGALGLSRDCHSAVVFDGMVMVPGSGSSGTAAMVRLCAQSGAKSLERSRPGVVNGCSRTDWSWRSSAKSLPPERTEALFCEVVAQHGRQGWSLALNWRPAPRMLLICSKTVATSGDAIAIQKQVAHRLGKACIAFASHQRHSSRRRQKMVQSTLLGLHQPKATPRARFVPAWAKAQPEAMPLSSAAGNRSGRGQAPVRPGSRLQ